MEEPTDWQQISTLVLIASFTGAFVSALVNKFIKSCPVLAVQASLLITLFIYPAINGYLFVLLSSDYDAVLSGKMNYLSYNSVMFFAPLPACILVTAAFSLFGKSKKTTEPKEPTLQAGKAGILKKAAWLMSIIMGGLWFITIIGKMTGATGKERLFALTLFTIYGLLASLIAWILLWAKKLL